jgi:hypothetical protein
MRLSSSTPPPRSRSRDRADDVGAHACDPERCVDRAGIVEIGIDLRVRLEAELTERVGDERAEPVLVLWLKGHDDDVQPLVHGRLRYGILRSARRYSYSER